MGKFPALHRVRVARLGIEALEDRWLPSAAVVFSAVGPLPWDPLLTPLVAVRVLPLPEPAHAFPDSYSSPSSLSAQATIRDFVFAWSNGERSPLLVANLGNAPTLRKADEHSPSWSYGPTGTGLEYDADGTEAAAVIGGGLLTHDATTYLQYGTLNFPALSFESPASEGAYFEHGMSYQELAARAPHAPTGVEPGSNGTTPLIPGPLPVRTALEGTNPPLRALSLAKVPEATAAVTPVPTPALDPRLLQRPGTVGSADPAVAGTPNGSSHSGGLEYLTAPLLVALEQSSQTLAARIVGLAAPESVSLSAVFLPLQTGLLSDLSLANTAAVEQGLRALVDELATLSASVVAHPAVQPAGWWLLGSIALTALTVEAVRFQLRHRTLGLAGVEDAQSVRRWLAGLADGKCGPEA
jgi:hypothetical protein